MPGASASSRVRTTRQSVPAQAGQMPFQTGDKTKNARGGGRVAKKEGQTPGFEAVGREKKGQQQHGGGNGKSGAGAEQPQQTRSKRADHERFTFAMG